MGRGSLVASTEVPYAGKMARHGRVPRGSRGATGVEYALVLSLFVLALIPAAALIERNADDEVDQQADCISTRPPPSSCIPTPLIADGGPSGGAGSGPGGGGGVPGSADATVTKSTPPYVATPDGPRFDVQAGIILRDDDGDPIPNTVVTAKVTYLDAAPPRVGKFFYVNCTTDSAGQCIFDFSSGFPDVEQLRFDVVTAGIDTTYDFGDYAEETISRP